ncbi:MAG TPA: transglutaminase family protein, partial [Kofleriaceae bacterium]|nr:transglutaminase family protein [Kofleriaceae bacterium]
GLVAARYHWNGDLADSGGGGHISLGGPRAEASPFLRYPHVLPALVRYLNNHPSLSYWFASECVGSASQGPRPDEGTRERWDELAVTLGWLERLADRGELSPQQLASALGPLLVDAAGNSHRAELDVEKLWNPHITAHGPRHGRMGIVELRSIRMPERPEMLAAAAALFRAIVTRLVVADYRAPLVDWHDELHDQFALPAALARDLRRVLGDLDEHGLGLPPALRIELDAWRSPGLACRIGEHVLTIRPALEFWPTVGDVASQAGARIVDASTVRLELSVDATNVGPGPERVAVAGRWIQLRDLGDGVRAIGIRRRIFEPSPGLHPAMPAQDPLVIEWANGPRMQRVELWSSKPGGGSYATLPANANEALARRNERVRIVTSNGSVEASGYWRETRPFTIDLRGACETPTHGA